MTSRKLIIVRHGEGEHLIEAFFSSRPDHPNYRPANLTELGRAQSVEAGRQLQAAGITDANVQVVLVSPLPRTVQTAEGLFEGSGIARAKQVIEPLLIEIGLGEKEGTSTDVWEASGRGFNDFSDGHTYGGETNDDVADRMRTLLERIRTTYSRGHVIAITHALPGYELSGILTGEKTQLAVAAPLLLDLPV